METLRDFMMILPDDIKNVIFGFLPKDDQLSPFSPTYALPNLRFVTNLSLDKIKNVKAIRHVGSGLVYRKYKTMPCYIYSGRKIIFCTNTACNYEITIYNGDGIFHFKESRTRKNIAFNKDAFTVSSKKALVYILDDLDVGCWF